MANEINGVAVWMRARLVANPTITDLVGKHPKRNVWQVYEGAAPQGARYPLVVFQFVSGPYRTGSFGKKIFLKGTWQVRVFSESEEFASIGDVADAIEEALHQETDLTQPTVIGCIVARPLQGVEETEGARRNYLGSEFTVFARTRPGV